MPSKRFNKVGEEIELRQVEKCCSTCKHGGCYSEGEMQCTALSQRDDDKFEWDEAWTWPDMVCDLWEKEIEDAKV